MKLFPTVLFAEAVLQKEMVTATGNVFPTVCLLKLFYRWKNIIVAVESFNLFQTVLFAKAVLQMEERYRSR